LLPSVRITLETISTGEFIMEKLLAMNIAAQLTQAACGNAGASLPISADLSDTNVRAKNLQAWETFRVFYRGVIAALADDTNWPPPQLNSSQLMPGLVQSLTPLLQQSGLSSLVTKLLAVLPAPAAAPQGPLPDPGAAPTPTPAPAPKTS
jgi:hypothetical protein